MTRKILILALAVIMSALLLIACAQETAPLANEDATQTGNGTESQQEVDNGDTTYNDAVEGFVSPGGIAYPVEGRPSLTIARIADPDLPTAGFTSYNETPNTRMWSELTGIDLEFIEPVDVTAMNLYLASGQLADVIITSLTMYPGGVGAMIADGIATDITDLLMEHAPDYWSFVNEFPLYLNSATEPDGRHYTIPGVFFGEAPAFRHWFGMILREEFLVELGMDIPETLDEFETFLRRSRDELGVDVPFMSDAFRTRHMFNFDGIFTSPFGLVSTGLYHIDGEVFHGSFQPEYRDFLEWMNMLFSEGLMDNNFVVTDEPTANAAMMAGQTAAAVTGASRIANMMNAMDDPNFTIVGMPSLRQANGERAFFSFGDAFAQGVFSVFIPESTSEENRVAAANLFNFLFTEPGIILSNFGEEGRTFTMVDGQPTLTEHMTNNPDGFPIDGLLRVNAMLNFPIIFTNEMSVQRYQVPQQIQAFNAWAYSYHDAHRIQNTAIAPEFTDEFTRLWVDIETYMVESRAQFIAGVRPLTEFDDYIQNLINMGMERVMEIYNLSFAMYNG